MRSFPDPCRFQRTYCTRDNELCEQNGSLKRWCQNCGYCMKNSSDSPLEEHRCKNRAGERRELRSREQNRYRQSLVHYVSAGQ